MIFNQTLAELTDVDTDRGGLVRQHPITTLVNTPWERPYSKKAETVGWKRVGGNGTNRKNSKEKDTNKKGWDKCN